MPRKDVENVLRNLYCFLEILQNSRSEEVWSWDKQSLDNAMKWAAFAEQAITQSNERISSWFNIRRSIFDIRSG